MTEKSKAKALAEILGCVREIDRICDSNPTATDADIGRVHQKIRPYKDRIDQLRRTHGVSNYEIMDGIAPYAK
jgi:hypothetical protein